MQIRNPNEKERQNLIHQVSTAFLYNKEEGNVENDFPQLYNSVNIQNLWAAFEGNAIIAHAGYFPTVMMVEGIPLPVMGVGGVYTDSRFQGQGLASQLIEKCLEEGRKKGAALAFLWSDKHEFYAKQGFHLIGRQWAIELEEKNIPALQERGEKFGLKRKDFRFVENEINDAFIQQSKGLLDSYPIGISRSLEEHQAYIHSGSCQIYSVWTGNSLQAYFLVGKGKDLPNYVHEWAGTEAGIHLLAAYCLEKKKKMIVISPQFMPEEVSWIYSLDEMGIPMRAEYFALVKLIDLNKVKKLLEEYLSRMGLKPSDFQVQKIEEKFHISWRDKTKIEFSEPDFMRFLFGPEMPAHPELKAFLPLRLWYWGMDSV